MKEERTASYEDRKAKKISTTVRRNTGGGVLRNRNETLIKVHGLRLTYDRRGRRLERVKEGFLKEVTSESLGNFLG